MSDDRSRIEDVVASSLIRAFEERDKPGYGTGTLAAAFFRVWMKERGNAYYFLFHKNLHVTNMQHAELLSLLTAYTFDIGTTRSVKTVQFVSTSDFIDRVQSLLDAIPSVAETDNFERQARWFAETYAHLLYYTAVVDAFYGSSSIHLPPHMDVHLDVLCGLSGYIHSCGRNVFVRNVSKAKYSHFSTALRNHLDRFTPPNDKPLFFSVYAHEDFPETDRERLRLWKNGLDDVKVHIDKSHMSEDSLVDVVRKLRDDFAELEVAEPDSPRRKRVSRQRTLWLVSDYGVQQLVGEAGSERLARSRRRYYICYDQLYDNKNPFQIFDENKPAWIAHTTIPHTLMAAMINVTLPDWSSKAARIGDPFVGSGTTWVEGWKYPHAEVIASDKSPAAVKAATDNAIFFALSVEELIELHRTIGAVAQMIEDPAAAASRVGGLKVTAQKRVRELTDRVLSWERLPLDSDPDAMLHALQTEEDLDARVLLYLALRAHKRHGEALKRRELNWSSAFVKEAMTLANQIERFRAIRKRPFSRTTANAALVVCPGDYSDSVTIAPDRLSAFSEHAAKSPPREFDAADLALIAQESGRFDVIVTDPPYGFNTDEDAEALAKLYVSVLRAAVRSLRDGGQLVVCVPEISTVGKDPSAFTHRTVIAHQVIALAAELGKEVVSPCRSRPGPKLLYQAPYYWASERALRRAILHFRIVERQNIPHC